MRPNILLVDDHQDIIRFLKELLDSENNVLVAENGQIALDILKSETVHVVISDVMMPVMDGYRLTTEIRKSYDIPIILLTAKSQIEDKEKGYDLGADDYIIKPFDEQELLWKIKALIRRIPETNGAPKKEIVTIGKYTFDFQNQSLSMDGKIKRITEKESDILNYLAHHQNHVIKREDLLKDIWGENDYFFGRSLDVFITKIRKYLSADPTLSIENVFGVGFIFNVPDKNKNG